MPATQNVPPDVRAILEAATIDATSVQLVGQLDRSTYQKVAKVIEAAGGKWNRKAGKHLFQRDPREALGLAITTGQITDTKKALQQFFTPASIASLVAETAQIEPGHSVLEPSAGNGALAEAARLYSGPCSVTCIEIDPVLADGLAFKGFSTITGDFLGITPPLDIASRFDRIVMNPPFTGGQDIAHVMHALEFVKPGGRLVAIMAAGIHTNSSKAHRAFRELIEMGGTIRDLPEAAFRESGTDVRTVMVVL